MGFSLGRFRIYFDFTFFAMLGLYLCLDAAESAWWMLSALLLHEAGHLLAAYLTDIQMEEMRFTCFGIRLLRRGILAGWKQEALVFLGGPLANLGCALLLIMLARRWEGLLAPGALHLAMGCFQLLPVGALDGGCLMRGLLERFVEPRWGQRIGTMISAAALLPLFGLGCLVLRGENRNFTLLICCCFLMLSVIWEEIK